MNDKWVEFAIRIQSIAQAGLQYGKDKYDRERYEELRQIAAGNRNTSRFEGSDESYI